MYLFVVFQSVLNVLYHRQSAWATQPMRSAINFDDFDKEAVVEEIIEPGKCGQVRYRGSWWNARCIEAVTLYPGETVYVIRRHALTLVVRPAEL
jgi:membrane protein implicated in regulation of membrane protease activity